MHKILYFFSYSIREVVIFLIFYFNPLPEGKHKDVLGISKLLFVFKSLIIFKHYSDHDLGAKPSFVSIFLLLRIYATYVVLFFDYY